jgi:hypothetical protein
LLDSIIFCKITKLKKLLNKKNSELLSIKLPFYFMLENLLSILPKIEALIKGLAVNFASIMAYKDWQKLLMSIIGQESNADV